MSRPAYKPSADHRKLVRSLAAIGMRHDDITIVVGLRSPKTLRKYFRRELDAGCSEAIAAVSRVAFEMATSGNCPTMTEYWLSTMGPPVPIGPAEEPVDRPPCFTTELVFNETRAEREEVEVAPQEI
jgi:hypothetical protein